MSGAHPIKAITAEFRANFGETRTGFSETGQSSIYRARAAACVVRHLADKIISIVTVTAPGRHAAVAIVQAVVSDALKRHALSSSQWDMPGLTAPRG